MEHILGIVVTYYPDPKSLKELITSLQQQVNQIVIIDNNTPGIAPQAFCFSEQRVSWILNFENLGVAAAYNQGVKVAYEQKASHLLLFDQDSNPAGDMVKQLLRAMKQSSQPGSPVAAAGPNYVDKKGQDKSPFVRLNGFKLSRVLCADDEVVNVDHLISSGCLIDLRHLCNIGGFIDELFIDYVDTEWSWRARRSGYNLIGVGAAKMIHNIGDRQIVAFGRRCTIHEPIRVYYQFRNQMWMILQPWVGWQWRIMDIYRFLKIITVFLLFVPNRTTYFRLIFRGVIDGIRKKMGKLDRL